MGINRYPGGRIDHLDFKKGLDTVNTLTQIELGAAQNLDNMEYRQGTISRRKPFVEKSTTDFSQAADFGNGSETPGIFKGAHEYVDADGTSRVLAAHTNGSILEFVNPTTSTYRDSFATPAKKVRFETMLGAGFLVNGADNMKRVDGTAYRKGGAITPPTGISLSEVAGANVANGVHIFAVVSVLESGGVGLVLSDWLTDSITVTGSPTAVKVDWTDSVDSRATHVYIYKSITNLGAPLYFFAKVAVAAETYTFNLADSARTVQAAPQFKFAEAPTAALVTRAGKRLVVGKITGALNALHLSALATDNYAMEYFPNDGKHRIQLPGKGPLTALRGIGVKDELENRDDLFIAQKNSCYILRNTNPDSILEPIAGNVGCINPDAVVDWQGFVFFVSLRGLEFYGPQGKPLLISNKVQTLFDGGNLQTPTYNGFQGDDNIYLEIWENKLLIVFRDDSAKVGGNKTLVMDLETFDPYSVVPWKTARFSGPWTGPGMFTYLALQDRELVLFDNQNTRMLKRSVSVSVSQDVIAGVNTKIKAKMYSGGILGEQFQSRKRITTVNVWQICDSDTTLIIEADYNHKDATKTLTPNTTEELWDKIWDKSWGGSARWLNCASIPRRVIGSFFQVKIEIENVATDYVFIGFCLNYTKVLQRLTCVR